MVTYVFLCKTAVFFHCSLMEKQGWSWKTSGRENCRNTEKRSSSITSCFYAVWVKVKWCMIVLENWLSISSPWFVAGPSTLRIAGEKQKTYNIVIFRAQKGFSWNSVQILRRLWSLPFCNHTIIIWSFNVVKFSVEPDQDSPKQYQRYVGVYSLFCASKLS